MPEYKETLRKLALNDESFVDSVLGMGRDTVEVSRLDQKTHALVRLGAALAIDAAPSSYQSNVEVALAAGASIDEIVGSLIAVAPTIGLTRVVSAAPELALALGYDVEAALETPGGQRVTPPPACRVPHRVGRRSLVHLVEHRKLRADATPSVRRSDRPPPYVLRTGGLPASSSRSEPALGCASLPRSRRIGSSSHRDDAREQSGRDDPLKGLIREATAPTRPTQKGTSTMSTFLWLLLVVLYFVALVVLGMATLRKGHTVLFWVGFILPVLWIVGALMQPTSSASAVEARNSLHS